MGDATTCVNGDCPNKPARSGRGHCHKHYLAKLADGSLPRLIKGIPRSAQPTGCSAENCGDHAKVKGFCRLHYLRWLKHGNPDHAQVRVAGTCSEEGCGKPLNGGGLCGTHYSRLRRYGSTEPRPRSMPTIERFKKYVDISAEPGGCHIWTGRREADGYGLFSVKGRWRRATRWILGHIREVPLADHEWALHHCDNPPCVNPSHLYIGDHLKNVADRVSRGRSGKRPPPTQCPNGHEYTEGNVYLETGKRMCLTCRTANLQRRYARAKQRRAAA